MADTDDYSYGVAVQYGNPGPATYSTSTQAWSFARHHRHSKIFSFTGWRKKISLPATNSLTKNEDELWENYPELIAIAPDFAEDEKRSRLICEADSHFNPQTSSLLDFGNAQLSPEIRSRQGRIRLLPIAAFVSGRDGDAISFRPIDTDEIRTNLENHTFLNVPTISDSKTEWICSEHPVRQIRFADSVEDSECFLAVRFQSCTGIFQPIYYQEAQLISPPVISGRAYSEPQVSHIDPKLIVEIGISQTGGYTHVDVAFNPWYSKQFAIIDERGHWSIWEFRDTVKHNENVTPKCLRSGFLPPLDNDNNGDEKLTDKIQYDGWGRIAWVKDVYTFIVCGRRNAVLYVSEEETILSSNVQLNWQSETEWILDVKTSLTQAPLIFILTTLRILCFDVSAHEHGSESLLPRSSWQHGRDPDDLTLRLTTSIIGEEYYLLFYSRLDACILAFYVSVDESEGDGFVSDPFWIYVPGVKDTNGLETIRYEFPIKQLLFKEIEQSPLPDRNEPTQYPRLMKLFMVDSMLAVHEYLFSKLEDIPAEEEFKVGHDVLSSNMMAVFQNRSKSKGKTKADKIKSSGNETDIFHANNVPLHTHRTPSIFSGTARSVPLASVDFTKIYGLISSGDLQQYIKRLSTSRKYEDFKEYMEHLAVETSTSAEEGPSFVQTMLDVINNPPTSSDIDDSAQELERFQSRFNLADASEETALCFLPFKISAESLHENSRIVRSFQSPDLLKIYDKLMRDWLSPLLQTIPGWTRISKERLIRQISVELSLTSTIQVDRPVPRSGSVVSSQVSLSEQDTLARVTESNEDPQTLRDILGLRTVSPRSKDVALSLATQSVLSYWTIGGDPESFDWEKALMTSTGDKNAESRSRSRSKSVQRAQARIRSRSRATSEGLRAIRISPAAPPVTQFPSSQPQFDTSRLLPIRSSQMTEDIPMTQVERGVYGSREAGKRSNVKARKKKRAAGF